MRLSPLQLPPGIQMLPLILSMQLQTLPRPIRRPLQRIIPVRPCCFDVQNSFHRAIAASLPAFIPGTLFILSSNFINALYPSQSCVVSCPIEASLPSK
eukprot:CCRYP_008093-RD/>CCRYP_008093-RD protein AED:0.44 eAED:0.52 QI:0/0.5/0.33/1/0/0/3/602/97